MNEARFILTESMKAPKGLKALETTNDSVMLGWTEVSSTQADGYRLEQSIAFERKWVSAQGDRKLLPATITEFTVVDLAPYKEYHFCVRSAIDRMGELVLSKRSVPLYVVTRKPYQPYQPRNLKLTDCTLAPLSLTWKEPSPAADVNRDCYEYVVEMCTHGNDKGLKRWTEYRRTTECQCPINVQGNGVYRFRVSANNTEKEVTSLPEEMGDPDIPIRIRANSEWLIEALKTFWPFSATTQPRSQESGSIIFNISCHDLEGLRELWMNYKLGKVKRFFKNLFARLARLSSVQADTELEIKIDKEDFYSCRRHLLLTTPTSKGFRVVRLGEGHFRGTQLGLSEDYPGYCKPISHKTTCSQLDFLDPAIPVDQLGLDRTICADKLFAVPPPSRPVHYSSLPGLDLAVSRDDQSRKHRPGDISKLRAAVQTGIEKSRRLEVQFHAAKAQLETERQETKALKKVVTKLTAEKEKAQKIILDQKTARQQTDDMVLNLTREASRQREEKEQAQKILQEQKIEIQQLQENNKSMAATIEELVDAKHTRKGESGGQDHGRKKDPEKETYTGETEPGKKKESGKRSQSGPKDRPVILAKAMKGDKTESTSQPKKTIIHDEARKRFKTDPDGAGPSWSGDLDMDQEPQTSHSADILRLHSKFGFNVEELKPKEGGKTTKGSSIPLILPNDLRYNAFTGEVEKVHGTQRATLHVVPEALALLEVIEEPVSVISICGPCRTGKSYLLSRLLGTADAFELGHRMDPQTFGIWMGTKVLRGKDFTIVLLDTEGIDTAGASADQDASILVMTILLSSHLIYNSLNVPYKRDLEKMECFIRLAKGIAIRKGEKTRLSSFCQFFPDFLWLLRDVHLKPVDEDGRDMTPTEYLITKVLRHVSDDFDESTSDKVGRALLTFFPSVECATLERPSEKKEVMKNIAQHTDSLNPEFNNGLHALMEKLLPKARAKRGYNKGSTVSGAHLSIMTKQYVEAVNDPNSIPALDNTWKNTIKLMQDKAIEESVTVYKHQMHSQIAAATNNGKVPLEESAETEIHLKPVTRGRRKHSTRSPPSQQTLMDLHIEFLNKVTDMLLEKIGHFGIRSGDQCSENKFVVDRMQHRLVQREKRSVDHVATDGTIKKQEGFVVTGGELLNYIQQNIKLSKSFCQDLFERLLDPIRKHVESPPADYDMKKLTREVTDARQKYVEQARGPEKWTVLQEMSQNTEKLKASFKTVHGYQREVLQAQQREHEAELRAKEKEREMQQLRKQVEDMQKSHQETLGKMEWQYREQIKKINQELEEQLAVEEQKIQDLQNAKMEEQAQIARERLEKQKANTMEMIERMEQQRANLQRELQELKDREGKEATPTPTRENLCTIS